MDGVSGCALSLVIPAYNEEAGIATAVAEADAALRGLGIAYEIVVVDDGSGDATAAAVAGLALPAVRLERHGINRGYGAALRTGFESARGELIAFTDADGQFDLADLAKLLPLAETHPVAVGYRVDRQDPWLRKFYSRGYNLIARTLLGTQVRDIDCALKVFRRDALARLLPECRGFFVNTEMLTRAAQQRLRVAEAGVRHRPRLRGTSKVSLADIPRTLNALLPFWWSRVVFAGKPIDRAPGRSARLALVAMLLVMASALFCCRLGQPLLEPEEARYAEIPRQMLAEGRLITPVLHGEAYFQKPPLLYWLVMAAYETWGIHDAAARLVPALAGVLTVLITALWGWRTLGFWSGLTSGVILCLSGRFLYLAGMVTIDGLLTLWVVAGLACGHLALIEGRRGWLVLAALAVGLGILTKGPVALGLVLAPLALLTFLDRRCIRPTRGHLVLAAGVVLLVAGPWYVAAAIEAPTAVGTFLWLHNVVRFFAPFDHEQPAWVYLPSLLLGALPWTLLLIPATIYLARRSARAGQRRPAGLGVVVLGLLTCVGFFSLSGCKRPAYILPAFPLLALLLGAFLTHGLPWQRWLTAGALQSRAQRLGHRLALRMLVMTWILATVLGGVMAARGWWSWPQAGIITGALGAFVLIVRQLQASSPAITSWGGCSAALFILLLLAEQQWLPGYQRQFTLREEIREQLDVAAAEMPILSYPRRWDSISFYLQRGDVKALGKQDLADELRAQGRSLLFVKRDGDTLRELGASLPLDWEFVPRGLAGRKVIVGVVQPRE